jgi:hypothetical protein
VEATTLSPELSQPEPSLLRTVKDDVVGEPTLVWKNMPAWPEGMVTDTTLFTLVMLAELVLCVHVPVMAV